MNESRTIQWHKELLLLYRRECVGITMESIVVKLTDK